MSVIFLCVVLAVIIFAVAGIRFSADRRQIAWGMSRKQLLAILPLLGISASFFTVIPVNSVGILFSPIDGVRDITLQEGLHPKGVIDQVYTISTEVQTKNLTAMSGQTKDAQYISMSIDVKYRIDSQRAFEVFKQFRTLEAVDFNLISPTVQRSIETITTQFNIIEILGEQRNTVYREIENYLREEFAKSGIEFYSITFVDTDAGAEIEQAIRNEAIAKKSVETAEQERLRIEIEAQQRIVLAKADQEKAQIDAETKVIQAQAEADANRILSDSITPELLDRMEMEARLQHGWVTVNGADGVIVDQNQSQASGNTVYRSEISQPEVLPEE
jgi:regulator of protease activity HflC (stomatin/prohibitin superfamily)